MENKISDVLRKQDENERLNEMFANAAGSEDAALREVKCSPCQVQF